MARPKGSKNAVRTKKANIDYAAIVAEKTAAKVDFSFRPALIGTGSTAILSRKSVLVAVGELPAAHRADL